jgi:virginiamycin B lyase
MITTAGVVTEFPIPTAGSFPSGITAGPDGNLWFTENGVFANKIARITTDGHITEFPVPTALSRPFGITTGPDGALWFTEHTGDKIGRLQLLAGTPGAANCSGKSVSALAHEFGGLAHAADALGFASVSALQDKINTFCSG